MLHAHTRLTDVLKGKHMTRNDWPAEDYAIGSYIQATVADDYLKNFSPSPHERILDIGCGDGSYSLNLLKLIPKGQLLGIDSSKSMLVLANKKTKDHPNFTVLNTDVLNMTFENEFDHVVSFWCLQWTDDIVTAFKRIYQALKPGGKIFILFPSGDDPFMQSFTALKQSGKYNTLNSYTPTMNYSAFSNLTQKLSNLPFSKLNVHRQRHSIELPNLDVFRRFVSGIKFFQGQISDKIIPDINEAMTNCYEQYCIKNHGGRYLFNFSPYWVTGEK